MAVDDLDVLQEQMPHLFETLEVPSEFEADWAFERIGGQESDVRNRWFSDDSRSESPFPQPRSTFEGYERVRVPHFGSTFPGAPVPFDPSKSVPPPDALGFYLPFHSFYPTWWGVYLIAEGVESLGAFIHDYACEDLDWSESIRVAEMFIYFHEAFHHATECFATRLEIIYRRPLYTRAFRDYYRSRLGSGACTEEALACAHGMLKASEVVFPAKTHKAKQNLAFSALARYVSMLPLDYSKGGEYSTAHSFRELRSQFAEENLQGAVPGTPPAGAGVWTSFPHAFSGISRVQSRVNYVVHRSSPLFERVGAGGYYLTKKELGKRLQKLAGCRLVAEGSRHEIWEGPEGRFTIPRHPGDLRTGTLGAIIKQAGLNMSVSQFVSARP